MNKFAGISKFWEKAENKVWPKFAFFLLTTLWFSFNKHTQSVSNFCQNVCIWTNPLTKTRDYVSCGIDTQNQFHNLPKTTGYSLEFDHLAITKTIVSLKPQGDFLSQSIVTRCQNHRGIPHKQPSQHL